MDTYIDQFETVGYGDFAVQQIDELAVGVEPAFDGAIKHTRGLLAGATQVMREALGAKNVIISVTYTTPGAGDDPVKTGRDVLKRFVAYARSRPKGEAIAKLVLKKTTLGATLKQRPAKLAASLGLAVTTITSQKKSLPEHKTWLAEVTAAKTALDRLNTKVRRSRTEVRSMTPELQAKRQAWLVVYATAKLIVEAALKLHGKVALLPEIFDDLAEVHRVAGVSDGPAPPNAPADPAASITVPVTTSRKAAKSV